MMDDSDRDEVPTDAAAQVRRAQDLEINSRTAFAFEVHELAREMDALWDGVRRPWLEVVLLELMEEQHGRCGICGDPLASDDFQVDHIVPFSLGGGHERANIQLVHPRCNQGKGADIEPEVLLRHLEDLYMNR